MANPSQFRGYQVLTRDHKFIYTTKQIRESALTQALLGIKLITIEGVRVDDADTVLDLHKHGLAFHQVDFDYANMKQRIRLKLK